MTSVRDVLEMTKVALKAAGRREVPTIQKDYPEVGQSAVSLFNGDLNIYPTQITVKTIGGKRKVQGWAVDAAVPIPGTYWEPPDVDIVDVGESQSPAEAVVMAVMYIVRHEIWAALEATSEY